MKYSETFVVDPDQACQLQSVMLQRILICRSIRDHRQQQQLISTETWLVLHKVYIYLRQRKRYMFLLLFICLSVCLLARLLKNACMNLGEMLCVGSNWDLKKNTQSTLYKKPGVADTARQTARYFVTLNISINHSRSLIVTMVCIWHVPVSGIFSAK